MPSEYYTAPSGERLVCRRTKHGDSGNPPDVPIVIELLRGLQTKNPYGRRQGDVFRPLLHWHESKWLYITLALLTLCTVDAILTLQILALGGKEVNTFMATLIHTDVELFAWLKIALTAFGSVVLVAYNHLVLFRGFNVGHILLLLLLAYVVLIAYECCILATIFLL